MQNRYGIASLSGVTAMAAAGWVLVRPTRPAAPSPARVWNATHERIFLAGNSRLEPSLVYAAMGNLAAAEKPNRAVLPIDPSRPATLYLGNFDMPGPHRPALADLLS